MGDPLLKAHSKLEGIQFYGKFSEFGQLDMIVRQRKNFDVRHRVHLHALLNDFPVRVFQVASPNFQSAICECRKN